MRAWTGGQPSLMAARAVPSSCEVFMLTAAAEGVYAIAPTPFHPDGRIDEASTDRMVDFYGEAGCTGITVLGIMGEAPKLEHEEALGIATRVIRRAGRPVIVGVSA